MNDIIDFNKAADQKSAKRQEARQKIMETKTLEKGLIIVHTGKGKGKSTAAFGLVMRALGHGFKVGIVQFIKGAWETGEKYFLEKFPDQVIIRTMGEGFTWNTQDRARDIEMAKVAWNVAKDMIEDQSFKLIILDEINIALRYDYLDIKQVLDVLNKKRTDLHIVLTGRNAKDELIEKADLVTDMTMIKHHFRNNVKAQPGIEF
ncbi:MAG: cob(I)yrinic acid a,c-diamide adenosyltransferase [Alphaproteobacteria bacterium]|nr:cob(I)yrinic acid a,c-diamide adenosyltransferase [Alphaproteobacteria bacterium]